MEPILMIRDLELPALWNNRSVIVETDDTDKIVPITNAVRTNNLLFCIKLILNRQITAIPFAEEWQCIPLVIYPNGLGAVKDLIGLLPILKKLNVKFFLDGAVKENYEAVQILSSLGIYSGIVIREDADWERLTDVMYYALCGKVAHASIEPFQFAYDAYKRNSLVDYGTVYFNNSDLFEYDFSTETQRHGRRRETFFYEATDCAACAGWRVCLGKYEKLKDKTGCQTFTNELLNLIENLKFPILNS